jgi:hypothetical protein
MRVASREMLFVSAVMSLFLALGSSVNAQTAVAQKAAARLAAATAKLQTACASDLSKYCSTVTPGEGRLIFCMMAHEDKLSSKCDYALYDASRKMEHTLDLIAQAADACWNDIEKHCANIPEGGGRIAQCLVDNKKSVTGACKAALGKLPATK